MLMLAAILQQGLNAQQSLYGTVMDKITGESLPGAHIVLENTYLTAISGPDGQYHFNDLKEGTYKLKVSYIGYETIEKEVSIKDDLKMDFLLSATAIMQDEVVIRGIRTFEQEPPSFSNISKKEISSENMGQDLPYIMALSPSTVISSDAGNGVGYTSIRIRGTDMSGINITLNGIPLNDPESHGVWWVNMPDLASSIDNLQIQRGVGTSTNGAAAFGASINIQTKQYNADPYAEINSSFGSYKTFKNTLRFGTGLIKGRWSVDGRASLISSDGYIDRATSNLKSFNLSGAYHGEKSIYRINIFSGREKTYQAWAGVPKDSLQTNRTYNPYTYENETDNYQQDHYQFFYAREISQFWKVNAALFYVRGRGYYEQYKDDRSFSSYGLPDIIIGGDTISNTDLVQQKWLDNHYYGLTWSVNYKKDKLDLVLGGGWNQYDGDHYGEVIWAQYTGGSEIRDQYYSENSKKNDFNIFAKATYNLNENWSFFGDLQERFVIYETSGLTSDRVPIDVDEKYSFFNPKFGLTYTIDSQHHLYTSYARANKEPNRNDFENGVSKPEVLNDFELGWRFNTGKIKISTKIPMTPYFIRFGETLGIFI